MLLAVIFIAGSAVFELSQFQAVRKQTENMYNHPVTVSRAVSKIELNIVLIHREMKDIALGKKLTDAQHIVESLHIDTLSQFDILKQRFLGDQTEIKQLEQLFIDWRKIRQKVIKYRQLGQQEAAYKITTTEGVEHIKKLTESLLSIKAFAEKKLELFYGNAKQTAEQSEYILVIIACISLLVFAAISAFIAKSIIDPIDKLSRFSKTISEGELRADIEVAGNSELSRLAQDMMDMRDNIKTLLYNVETSREHLLESEKLAALGGLVAGVAHDVNTPLGVSVTATSIIKEIRDELKKSFADNLLTSQQFEQLLSRLTDSSNMLEDNLNKATKIVRDFKLTAVDQVSEQQCTFYLMRVTRALVSSLSSETRKVPVTPKVLGDEVLSMNSYPGALTQIISHLIMNSVQHAFEHQKEPEIEISYKQTGNLVMLEYKDNGSGVESYLHKQIFDPFYTTKKGKTAAGLGLSLVTKLTQETLQGKLLFESEPDHGVHFTFMLPNDLGTAE